MEQNTVKRKFLDEVSRNHLVCFWKFDGVRRQSKELGLHYFIGLLLHVPLRVVFAGASSSQDTVRPIILRRCINNMASANELMETEDIHSPNSVEDISSSSDSSPVSFNDGTIAHKEIKNCDENEEENSNLGSTNFTRTGSNIESSNTDDISYGERDRSNEENDPLMEERTFADESNSGEHDIFGSVENKQVNIDGDNADNTIISSPQESNSDSENNVSDDDVLDIDVDAPVPSPFSDIGDISGPENAMISDILKETNNARDISPVLDGFAENFDSINASLHDGKKLLFQFWRTFKYASI